ncbi:hypothetical protein [Pseudonocardia sp. ICBG1034]|uniref:hypothetical protein n=1 Tax=Pseudonocardia sp. ICBG1034 TaxID=2844381 RepID=UPI001CCCDFAC|nr:hypothetical protein [Pseudonocardia sp. ICBG1034]
MPPIPCTDAVARRQPDVPEPGASGASATTVTVATPTFLPQHAHAPSRRVSAGDPIAFRPWHGLAVHRPTGPVDRLRACDELGARCGGADSVAVTGMRSASERPA